MPYEEPPKETPLDRRKRKKSPRMPMARANKGKKKENSARTWNELWGKDDYGVPAGVYRRT